MYMHIDVCLCMYNILFYIRFYIHIICVYMCIYINTQTYIKKTCSCYQGACTLLRDKCTNKRLE